MPANHFPPADHDKHTTERMPDEFILKASPVILHGSLKAIFFFSTHEDGVLTLQQIYHDEMAQQILQQKLPRSDGGYA